MPYLSIPFAVALTDESSWAALNADQSSFGIVRFHFKLDDVALNEPHKNGAIIGVFKKPAGTVLKVVKSNTMELQQVLSAKSIEKHISQSEAVAELAADLISKTKLGPLFSVDTGIKSKISQKLASSFTTGIELTHSEKVTQTVKLEIENEISSEIDDTIVSVPVYVKHAIDITLAYIDYLRVDYVRTTFGLRKKSRKTPKIVQSPVHPNRLKIGVPIATAYYWELLTTSSKFLLESEHEVEVHDPLEIKIREPRSLKQRHVEFPRVATLYQIANAAFPRKWIWRRSNDKHDWTEEELMAIEETEVRGKAGWWERHRVQS